MTVRYFRTADEVVYERTREALDSLWGLPANGQVTCFEPAATAPRDESGRIYLSLWSQYCDMPDTGPLLAGMLANGLVEELSRNEYFAAVGSTRP